MNYQRNGENFHLLFFIQNSSGAESGKILDPRVICCLKNSRWEINERINLETCHSLNDCDGRWLRGQSAEKHKENCSYFDIFHDFIQPRELSTSEQVNAKIYSTPEQMPLIWKIYVQMNIITESESEEHRQQTAQQWELSKWWKEKKHFWERKSWKIKNHEIV